MKAWTVWYAVHNACVFTSAPHRREVEELGILVDKDDQVRTCACGHMGMCGLLCWIVCDGRLSLGKVTPVAYP